MSRRYRFTTPLALALAIGALAAPAASGHGPSNFQKFGSDAPSQPSMDAATSAGSGAAPSGARSLQAMDAATSAGSEAGLSVGRSLPSMDAATSAGSDTGLRVAHSLPAMDAATSAGSDTGLRVAHSLQAMDAATAASQTSTHGPASLPAMDAATAATPAPAPSLAAALVESANDNGFDWGDAGVGASGLMAAFLLAFGSVAYLQRRKGGPLRKAGARAAIS